MTPACRALWLGIACGPGLVWSAAARPLVDISAAGSIGLCVQTDGVPFSDYDTRSGLFIDLGRALAASLGVRLDPVWILSDDTIDKVECDLLPAGSGGAGQTIPWAGVSFVVARLPAHPPIRALADLGSAPVAVLAQSYARHRLTAAHVTLRVAYLREQDILDDVASGKVGAGIVSAYALQWHNHNHPGARLAADPAAPLVPGLDYQISVTLRDGDPPLRQHLDQALRHLRDSGALAAMFRKYGLTWQPPSR